MIGAMRAEILRARSGFNTLAVLLLAGFVPVIVLTSDDTLGRMTSLDAETAAGLLFAPVAWTFVVAAFAGAFGVTRESYYGSMGRTVVQVGFARAFVGKVLAAMVVGLVLTAGLILLWCGVVAVVLNANGLAFAPSPAVFRTALGALPATALGSVFGAAVGWIVGNYYAAAALVLAGPIALELALLGTAPDVARFLPGLSLAALASPQNHPVLLSPGGGLAVALAWALALTTGAWIVGRRRFA
ncbi:ABC transporter permease [Microbacterium sp. VKM Ac-2923]|uniref:ABC transporter permease n=1 Tax=Microbacterium sp. VKM Ac-2923 TaxID=2929476 RepID=UPI001FB225C1|nr:ABC transporter permease [Microbacterium sp. VKM Ac-2923]MCJ1706586.1 ABC transporter permease [Microbacterium sp. VKM Ac-2923]